MNVSTSMNATLSKESLRLLPEHMREAARRYVEEGLADDDGFVVAVASNDLLKAFRLADHTNTAHMRDWVSFFYAYVPSDAWGSPGKATAWMQTGGLRGLQAARDTGRAVEDG